MRLEFDSSVGRPKQCRRAGPEEPLEAIFGSYLVGLTLVVLLVMRADALRDRCQLVSTRNFFLLGLLLFQTVSGALTLLLLVLLLNLVARLIARRTRLKD